MDTESSCRAQKMDAGETTAIANPEKDSQAPSLTSALLVGLEIFVLSASDLPCDLGKQPNWNSTSHTPAECPYFNTSTFTSARMKSSHWCLCNIFQPKLLTSKYSHLSEKICKIVFVLSLTQKRTWADIWAPDFLWRKWAVKLMLSHLNCHS